VLPAVVLAGGESARMGTPKALLRDRDGRMFIARIAHAFGGAGFTDLVIVTGRHHERIVEAVLQDQLPVAPRIVRNLDPSRGQLSSLWTAMDEVCHPDTEAIAVTLVDVPRLAASTIRDVVAAWRRTRAPIVRPAVGVRRGHPVIFDRAVFDELRAAPLDRGARAVVDAHFDEIVNVPVDDPGCLVDVDTPEDYQELLRRE
jgi:molybdenum cofactor cytidylyltransferase